MMGETSGVESGREGRGDDGRSETFTAKAWAECYTNKQTLMLF